jgi:ATP-dependent DNA helicase RecG
MHDGEVGTCSGIIEEAKQVYTRSRITIQRIVLRDEQGTILVQFFNQRFLLNSIKKGMRLSCAGNVKLFGNKLYFIPETYEVGPPRVHTGRLVPIYPEVRGMSTRLLRDKINGILDAMADIDEYMPVDIMKEYGLMSLKDALYALHRPTSQETMQSAHNRFAFDELLRIQIATKRIRANWDRLEQVAPCVLTKQKKSLFDRFIKSLPFQLTPDQAKSIQDILKDISSTTSMNRFLQGDVGSGKTIVAVAATYALFLCGKKTMYMAPTELLAVQQFNSFKSLLAPLGLSVGLLTGSKKLTKSTSDYHVLVGTHALLTGLDHVEDLGLAIIDEQHRFGVKQRALLKTKGNMPHLLTMTATPIPRTVALTVFGDLDMSTISTMPAGRKEIKTYVVTEQKRADAYAWIRTQVVKQKEQVFVVCPLIEGSESETLQSVKSASAEFERLRTTVFPDLSVGLLHGKMKSDEKSKTLDDFAAGKIQILVSTSVVEVGIDIPNATIMCIEGAERFGLAQLHQLRGRVGRSAMQSYCLLFPTAAAGTDRLHFFAKHTQGMELAEYDLKMRGPGSLYGFEQHGYLDLVYTNLSDLPMIEQTKKAADYIISHYHEQDYPEFFSSVLLKEKELVAKD